MVDTARGEAWCYTVKEPKPWGACYVKCHDDPVLVARYSRLTPTQARIRAREMVQSGSRVVTIRQNGESVAILSANARVEVHGPVDGPAVPCKARRPDRAGAPTDHHHDGRMHEGTPGLLKPE